jgi:hypothetical protein
MKNRHSVDFPTQDDLRLTLEIGNIAWGAGMDDVGMYCDDLARILDRAIRPKRHYVGANGGHKVRR